MKKLDLIIPAYNEQHRIEKTLMDYISFFAKDDVRLVVVLNGCTDDTLSVVEKIRIKYPERVHIEDIKAAIGKGGAIIHGWKLASTELVGFVDADGATPPEEFSKLIAALGDHDGIIASRFLADSTIHQRQSPLRTIVSHSSIAFIKLLFGMPFNDTQCGAKVFNGEVIRAVLPHLAEHNLMFDVELLWILHRWGYDIQEMPTVWIDQPGSAMLGSHSKFIKTSFKMLYTVLRLRARGVPNRPVA